MSGIVGGNLGRGSGLVKVSAIDDNSVTLAKMAGLARGSLIHGDASGDPAALAVGGADEVLTHDGTDFDWAAASGGGKVVQMVTARHRGEISSTVIDSTWYTLANPSLAITPTATDNTILIQWYTNSVMGGANVDQDRSHAFDLERVITGGATTSRLAYTADGSAVSGLGYRAGNVTHCNSGASPYAAGYSFHGGYGIHPYIWADTTYDTTSVCTYKLMAKSYSLSAGTYYYSMGSLFTTAVAWEVEG